MSPTETSSIAPTQTKPARPDPLLPIAETGRVTEFRCPCCNDTLLEVTKVAKAEVCACPKCLGIIVDNDTCGGLISSLRLSYDGPEETPRPMNQDQLRTQRNCPACGDLMEVHPYYGPGNAIIDSCLHCKLSWFDSGELEQIIRAPGLRQPSHVPAYQGVDLVKAKKSQNEQFREMVTDFASGLLNLFR